LIDWGDGSGVPPPGSAKDLLVLGIDHRRLLCHRLFLPSGGSYAGDETGVAGTKAGAIAALKEKLRRLLPPHELTGAEKVQILREMSALIYDRYQETLYGPWGL
jgi:hypothetical protein